MLLRLPSQSLKHPAAKDKGASHHINILGHYDDQTLLDKNGQLIRLFRLSGMDALTQASATLDQLKNRRNSLFKSFSSEFALYSWTVRRQSVAYPHGEPEQPYARYINNAYKHKIQQTALYHSTLYLGLVVKPPEGKLQKALHWAKRLSHAVHKARFEEALTQKAVLLKEASERLVAALAPYGIVALDKTERNGKAFSEPLSLLSELINAEASPMPFVLAGADKLLSRYRVFANPRNGTFQWNSTPPRFGSNVTIKTYANFTVAGLLDTLNALPHEFILTQSFRFYDRAKAKAVLRDQHQDLTQTGDEAVSQTEAITDALNETASGDSGLGIHHLSILCLSDSLPSLSEAISQVSNALSEHDIVAVKEDMAAECSFWAQIPGNFAYIPRPAPISTRNLAGFMSWHNDASGRIEGNYWGDAVTVLETLCGNPYYFNFHTKDVGNTLIFGSMGSGKTVLKGLLLALSLKFGGKRIVFDKDRGLEILIRALGGHYEILRPGEPTGFNPCHLPDTPNNRAFLNALFKKILTSHAENVWNEEAAQLVTQVVDRLYTLPLEHRRFCHIAPFFGTSKKGSLRARFDEWHSDGDKAWVFDNPEDTLHFDHDIVGFEMGQLLKAEEVKTPACMYLLHRAESALDGQRGALFIDEGWALLSDPYFAAHLNDWGRTPRKKNRFLCLSTQSADDAVNSAVSSALVESASCKIFFPNPSAKREVYIDALGLSEREYELIKTVEDDKNFFLLNVGKGKESVIARANLSGLNDILAVISGRTETVLLLDALRAHVGDDPAIWLPHFQTILNHKNSLGAAQGKPPAEWVARYFTEQEHLS